MKKRAAAILTAALLAAAALAGCGQSAKETGAQQTENTAAQADGGAAEADGADAASGATKQAAMKGAINVISREDGSGTRGAFIELFGIEEKNDAGEKIDNTTEDAEITNSTEVMLTSVAGDRQAIGYVSLGSLNDSVKALRINGAAATVEDIKNGSYEVSRPFSLVTAGTVSDAAADFMKFILSDEGQKVVEDNGYISQKSGGAFTAAAVSGKVTVAGSSSVTPVMEKLKEAYNALNPNVTIEVQQSDSTTGVTSALEGISDIGMISRVLKDSEMEKGANATVIALDGIAVIVNKENPTEELSSEQVQSIYTGETTDWAELG